MISVEVSLYILVKINASFIDHLNFKYRVSLLLYFLAVVKLFDVVLSSETIDKKIKSNF